jgi:CSLREA domain-containing protein
MIFSGCTYTVNTTIDAPDANPGDYVCERALRVGESRESAEAEGLCSLRAAIMEANATSVKDRIVVPAGNYNLNLPTAEGGGRLDIGNSVHIQGSGKDSTIISQAVGDGVFSITNGEVTINHVTIEGGDTQAGGGIRVDAATVEIADVNIRDNFGFTGGGGILVTEDGEMRIYRASIHDNHATGAFGGGIWNQGVLWVYESTISNNQSNRAGGIRNSGNMNLRNTTVSGNTATSPQAGVGGIQNIEFAVLNNVTITDNTGVGNNIGSFRGGGIQTTADATTVMKNSIVAGNDGGAGPDDCVGPLTGDSKYNLIGDTTDCTITSFISTYLLDLEPLLGPLTNNGATTVTHNLGGLSPARESAYGFPPPAINACESHDQRGVPRPQGAGECDMGALEVTSETSFITGFVLVDATTDTDIRPLRHGDFLDLNTLPAQISVRATTSGSPNSVVFDLDAALNIQTENLAPYSLGGDASGDYAPVTFTDGEKTLRATPYADQNGAGAAGGSLKIEFTVQA